MQYANQESLVEGKFYQARSNKNIEKKTLIPKMCLLMKKVFIVYIPKSSSKGRQELGITLLFLFFIMF